MSDDLDDRIAYLKQQRQVEGDSKTQKAADLMQAIDELQGLVRETAFKSATVEAKMRLVETQMDELEIRVKRTRVFLFAGIATSVIVGVLILAAALWLGGNIGSAARSEATTVRSANTVSVGVDVWDYAPIRFQDIEERSRTPPVNLAWSDVEKNALMRNY